MHACPIFAFMFVCQSHNGQIYTMESDGQFSSEMLSVQLFSKLSSWCAQFGCQCRLSFTLLKLVTLKNKDYAQYFFVQVLIRQIGQTKCPATRNKSRTVLNALFFNVSEQNVVFGSEVQRNT